MRKKASWRTTHLWLLYSIKPQQFGFRRWVTETFYAGERAELELQSPLIATLYVVFPRLIETLTSFSIKKKNMKRSRPWIFTMLCWIMQRSVNYSSRRLSVTATLSKACKMDPCTAMLCQHISIRIAYDVELSFGVNSGQAYTFEMTLISIRSKNSDIYSPS